MYGPAAVERNLQTLLVTGTRARTLGGCGRGVYGRHMAMSDLPAPRWVKLLDQSRCIGCHACTTACKSENEVPVGVTRTYVKSVDVGVFRRPGARSR